MKVTKAKGLIAKSFSSFCKQWSRDPAGYLAPPQRIDVSARSQARASLSLARANPLNLRPTR